MKFLIALILAFSSQAFAELPAKRLKLKVNLSAGSFDISGPISKGYAALKGGKIKTSKIVVDAKKLKTGMSLRDTHMLKRFKSKTITLSGVKLNKKSKKGYGYFTINKKKKKVILEKIKILSKKVCAKFTLNMKHYAIDDINYQGMGVKNLVQGEACIPLKKG